MASKRKPISFPELEPKGKNAILRSANEVQAEEEMLAHQHASMPDDQHAGGRAHYQKVTYRLSAEAIEAIDDAKRVLRRQYKLKASLEEIADKAILAAYADLLANQHASFLVSQLSSKMVSQQDG